jgi:hypothetical protein
VLTSCKKKSTRKEEGKEERKTERNRCGKQPR